MRPLAREAEPRRARSRGVRAACSLVLAILTAASLAVPARAAGTNAPATSRAARNDPGATPAAPASAADAAQPAIRPRCPPDPQPPTPDQARELAAQATDHGFLWRITKNGHSSYLYGSMHVGRLAWAFPGPALREAWAHTDTLALELDLTDPTLQAQMQQAIARSPQPALPASLRDRLARQVALACVPPHALDALPPAMQAATLSAVAGRPDGLEPAYAQEEALAGMAVAQQRRIVGLETAAEQVRALLPATRREAVAMVEEAIEPLEHDGGLASLRQLTQVWATSDLAALEDYPSWCDCVRNAEERREMRHLLDDRNPHLAERIDALHAQGRQVLAAVGALHMAGPVGLPRLMAARGYEVEQLLPRH
jgi:uncharacterized protein YbaP (TraB family)